MSARLPVLSFVLASALALTVAAEPYREGSVLPELLLEDQHGEPGKVDAKTRVVLFARDMDGGDLLKTALEDSGAQLLRAASAEYVADLSGMPGMIRRMFALPSLRRRDYRILVDSEGEITADLPSQEKRATFMTLQDLRVVRVEFFGSAEQVRSALERRAAPPVRESEKE